MTAHPAALVTGASRGIGRAIAIALADAGYDVAGVSRTARPGGAADPTGEAVRARGRRWLPLAADVSDLESHDGIVRAVEEAFGRLDLFVSNAGAAPERRMDVLETTPASFDRVMGLNLRGAFFLAQRAAACMLRHRAGGDGHPARLVFVGSISAIASSVNRAEYCISKAGLAMVVKLLADRLAADGIPVFEVRPGIIRTDMTAPVKDRYDAAIAGGLVPQRRWGEPEDVARAVAALARGDFDYATGSVIDVGGGLHLPRL